jgi:hypothetical protein
MTAATSVLFEARHCGHQAARRGALHERRVARERPTTVSYVLLSQFLGSSAHRGDEDDDAIADCHRTRLRAPASLDLIVRWLQ